MDLGKTSPLPFDLNSEPESSYHLSENQQTNSCLTVDINLPVDLNSIPESSYPSSQDQPTNSCLSIDLNSVPESPSLFVDLNLVPESCCHSSKNQQTNSCFQLEVDNQQPSFQSKRKRQQDDVDQEAVTIAKRVRAAREKSRRDKLNDSFQELGNILDSGRHKNSKRTILDDAISVLKGLTSELSRLRIENIALSEESHELIQEKSELRLEKASLKSDIENLELQFQRSLSFMLPLAPTDPSEFAAQSISCPVAVHAPSGPIAVHSPGLQTIRFFKDPSDVPSNSDSAFSPYLNLVTQSIDKPSTSIVSTSYNPRQQNFESKPSNDEGYEADNLGGLATELELMPGSISKKSSPRNKGKQLLEDDESIRFGNFFSIPSSS